MASATSERWRLKAAQLSWSKRPRSRCSAPRLWTASMLLSPSSRLDVVVAPAWRLRTLLRRNAAAKGRLTRNAIANMASAEPTMIGCSPKSAWRIVSTRSAKSSEASGVSTMRYTAFVMDGVSYMTRKTASPMRSSSNAVIGSAWMRSKRRER